MTLIRQRQISDAVAWLHITGLLQQRLGHSGLENQLLDGWLQQQLVQDWLAKHAIVDMHLLHHSFIWHAQVGSRQGKHQKYRINDLHCNYMLTLFTCLEYSTYLFTWSIIYDQQRQEEHGGKGSTCHYNAQLLEISISFLIYQCLYRHTTPTGYSGSSSQYGMVFALMSTYHSRHDTIQQHIFHKPISSRPTHRQQHVLIPISLLR